MVRAKHDITVVPHSIVGAIGDAVHNLRSALDHFACALALRRNPDADLERVAFPIRKDREAFDSVAKKGKINNLGSDAVSFIDRLKPYGGGDGVAAFWRVHRLDIVDKHRALLTTGIYTLGVPSGMPPPASYSDTNKWQALEENPVIARWPAGDPENHAQYIFNVALNEPEIIPARVPVLGVLFEIKSLVEAVLYKAERELSWTSRTA